MKAVKTTYATSDKFELPAWVKLKGVYVLKSSFLVIYEAEVDDQTGATSTVLLHAEYPKRWLRKFKRQFGLS